MNKEYRVRLTDEEQKHLEKLVRKGKTHARKLLYARILLKADENGSAWTDERIADAFEVSVATVARERRRYCEEGPTHSPAAFYEAFSPEIAQRLARKIEFCYTPVHGLWLNMVEIEISILVRQCLKRRLPDT
jgi:hypothetical protein